MNEKRIPYLYKKLLALMAVKHQSMDGEFRINQSIEEVSRNYRLSKSDMKIIFDELETMGLFEKYKDNTGRGKILPDNLRKAYDELKPSD